MKFKVGDIMASSTAFPVGTYVGGPNGNDPVENAQFESTLDQFSEIMGVRPKYMDAYTDNSEGDPSTWVANAGWAAWSYARTGPAYVGPGSGIVPVVGIPMSWSGESGSNVDAAFKDIASGKYDAALKAIVDAWINDGYKTIQFRIGYEFNVGSIPWDVFNSNASTAGQDFVAAFQRIANIVHTEATALGATAQVVWNPGTSTSGNTTQLYPGDQYVDVISLDEYSPTWTTDFTDWATGGRQQVDPVTWASNPVNREHFWQYSNATQQNPTPGLTSPGWSMQDAIAFAKQHNKPLSLSETGAGNSTNSTISPPSFGPVDDPDFPKWLSGALSTARADGVAIQNVNIWDVGSDAFNNSTRPLEAAAWAHYFGAGSVPSSGSPPIASPTVTIGSGPDTLALQVSEDSWQGNAEFTVAVDGRQIGGVQTTTALHSSGQAQTFEVLGTFAAGSHVATVDFLNDAWGGTPTTDRNLYVTGATIDNTVVPAATLTELVQGPKGFSFLAPGVAVSKPAPNAITVDRPAQLTAGVQTISGTETDPSQPVFLDWHTYGVPAVGASDWVPTTVAPSGVFSASVTLDHPGVQSTMFYHAGSGPVVAAWSATPS
jgi:hypothetical protein